MKTIWCPEPTLISNKDGLSGKTTIDEYNSADIKILAFGDSFTMWNQKGYTWPDLLESYLSKKSNKNVKILNYGVGGYGILQMFDLASDKIFKHNPDLVIFAFITDDLSRNRWWVKSFEMKGYERFILSKDRKNSSSSKETNDFL